MTHNVEVDRNFEEVKNISSFIFKLLIKQLYEYKYLLTMYLMNFIPVPKS